MNERAKEAGAINTNFTNAHGMPDDGHLSTAYDMARIMMAAVGTPGFNEIFSAQSFLMPPTNKHEEPRVFNSRNPMLTGYEGLIAEKTGWTISSQHTLVSAAERNGRRLVCAVLMSPEAGDKYEDTALLLDFGFEAFEVLQFTAEELDIQAGFSILVPKGADKEDIDVIFTKNGQDLQVRFTLKPSFEIPAYAELGMFELTVIPDAPPAGSVEAAAEVTGGAAPREEVTQGGVGGLILLWAARVFAAVLGLCVLLFIVMLIMRWTNIRRYRRRHRGRRMFR
jgi:D-alanyl-D-alanine carboxypeptidase